MTPAEVTKAVKTDKAAVRAAFKQLERSGIAMATGATMSRKWLLVGR